MFELGSRDSAEVVLAETGETIDLMLRFIYPNETPTIPSFDTLNKAMHVAKKYELEGMQDQLRRELAMGGSSVSYSIDPLGAYVFATTNNLKEETKVSLELARQKYQFNTMEDLWKISESSAASIPWILLIGIPCVKRKILSDVLLKFHEEPMKLQNSSLLCSGCVAIRCRYSPPEWQARWAHGLITELAQRPIDAWGPCFESSFLREIISRNGGTTIRMEKGVCSCMNKCTADYGRPFVKWSSGVHRCLVKRLEGMEQLEQLLS